MVMKKYPFIDERKAVWKEIAMYIYKNVGEQGVVLELGAGFCDFINQFPSKKKICIELNEERKKFASSEVDFLCGDVLQEIQKLKTEVSMVFASNFLEHFSEEQLGDLLPRIHNILNANGKLVLIQPNYRLCKNSYFDDETHQTIFSDENIVQFLEKFDFKVIHLIPGLLPFSMKSRLPKWPLLVRFYLNSPMRPHAAQMYVVAQKKR
jgi:SAM-dependent methyltransferase